jgi:hypothetical protein
VAIAALALASTSGGAPSRLTKPQYEALLARANAQVTKVETAAERGLTPKATPARVEALILAWATTETRLGKSFRAVEPPAGAAGANALLASGELEFGRELKYAATHLPRKTADIGPFLERRLGVAKGPRKVDRALAKLKALGYRIGADG